MEQVNEYLDKRKIAGIQNRAKRLVADGNWTGDLLTILLVIAFAISTTHLFWELRGRGFLGLVMGILTSIATEGSFLHHRYYTFPHHENNHQKFASVTGMIIAVIGSLFFISSDLLLLVGVLDMLAYAPFAIVGMVIVMLSAVLSESIYELTSHTAKYKRTQHKDALEILQTSDKTRLELERGDLEIMEAYSDLAVSISHQKAMRIRALIPSNGLDARFLDQPQDVTADDIRKIMSDDSTDMIVKDLAEKVSKNGHGSKN